MFSSALVREIINPIHRPGRATTVHGALGDLWAAAGKSHDLDFYPFVPGGPEETTYLLGLSFLIHKMERKIRAIIDETMKGNINKIKSWLHEKN